MTILDFLAHFQLRLLRGISMKICILVPAFNVEGSIHQLIEEFFDVRNVLELTGGHDLQVLVINDNSSDATGPLLSGMSETYNTKEWLTVIHNDQNLGLAANILSGYRWGVEGAADIVGCMDADGEHSPYALLRHLNWIREGLYDGVVGSIIFPDHDQDYHERNMMRFWGGMQAEMAGVEGMFYIQSPGYNLHRTANIKKALALYTQYAEFFTENSAEPMPRWGLHAVLIHLLAKGTGSNIKAAYLECFGQSPNRTPEKLLLQANAAALHMEMLQKFLAQ